MQTASCKAIISSLAPLLILIQLHSVLSLKSTCLVVLWINLQDSDQLTRNALLASLSSKTGFMKYPYLMKRSLLTLHLNTLLRNNALTTPPFPLNTTHTLSNKLVPPPHSILLLLGPITPKQSAFNNFHGAPCNTNSQHLGNVPAVPNSFPVSMIYLRNTVGVTNVVASMLTIKYLIVPMTSPILTLIAP